jgi:hypothetical protein
MTRGIASTAVNNNCRAMTVRIGGVHDDGRIASVAAAQSTAKTVAMVWQRPRTCRPANSAVRIGQRSSHQRNSDEISRADDTVFPGVTLGAIKWAEPNSILVAFVALYSV